MTPGRTRAIWGLAAGVAAVVALWFWAVRPNLVPKNFGVVDEGRVYRSGQLTPAAMRRVVEQRHIKTVIDLGSYWDGPRLADARGDELNQQMAEAMGVRRYLMPLYGDGQGNVNWYVHAVRIMNDPARQPVLVHCGAGSERTSVACILYEQLRHGAPDNAAGVEAARAFHHNPRKNPHVREVLDSWGAEVLRCVREGGQVRDPKFEAVPEPKPVAGLASAESGVRK